MLIEAAEKNFADILPDVIVAINNQGQLLWCNYTAEKLLSIKRRALKKITIQGLIGLANFKDFLLEPLYLPVESYLLTNNEIFISVKIIHRTEEQYLLLLRNITHLHYLEKMRQDFVANVSHELRTPLTVIHGYLELLLSENKQGNKSWNKMFTQMFQQSLRMGKLVEDLLLLSRLESGPEAERNQRPVVVSQLLETICADAKILSGDRAHVLTLEVDNELNLIGNEGELHAAFSNIIFNAVHYTPAAGKIAVSWQQVEQQGVLLVEDTGIGIAFEDIPRITERFYRVDKARSRESGGTGLGLAIVKHVLIRHEARLEIESRLGESSIFKCIFPRTRLWPSHT
jgi:two-component system phosphate regulon sensor histidine kinase PhoR